MSDYTVLIFAGVMSALAFGAVIIGADHEKG